MRSMQFLKTVALVAILLVIPFDAVGQIKKYRWSGEMCEYEARYNSRKYSPEQIRDTVLLSMDQEFSLEVGTSVALDLEEIPQLNAVALRDEYLFKRQKLAALKIIDDPYWNQIWRDRLNELDRVYQLSRATILSYKDPQRLRDVTYAPVCVREFAEPLIAGGQMLLDTWLKVNLASREKNVHPDRLRLEFERQSASPDKFAYARLEVTGFGWHNCVNAIARGENPDYDEIRRHLRKLFVGKIRERCEMP